LPDSLVLQLLLGAIAGFVGGVLASYIAIRFLARRRERIPLGLPVLGLRGRRPGYGRRYIVFEVLGVEPVGFDELKAAIEGAVRRAYGEAGEALLRLKLVEFDESRRRGIVRVRRDFKVHALAVLGLVRSLDGKRVLLAPLATTGSLRRARRIMQR